MKKTSMILMAVCLMLLSACSGGDQGDQTKKQPEDTESSVLMMGLHSEQGIKVQRLKDQENREWVPLKDAAKLFGFHTKWDQEKKEMEIGFTDPLFTLYADQQEAWAGKKIPLRNPPLKLVKGEPMVALNTFAELLDATIIWNADHSQVRMGLPQDELEDRTVGAAAASGNTVQVTGAGSLRTGPSIQHKVIRYLKIGESVTVIKKINSYWYSIKDGNGATGYVSSRYIPEQGNSAPATPAPVKTSPVGGTATAQKVLGFADQFLGTKYQFGAGPYAEAKTFDCSSFVQYVFNQHGYSLPRSSRSQAKVGQAVSRANLQPGDLVFFYTPGRFSDNKIVGHVAIYKGNGQIIHTYGSPGVTYSSLDSASWSKRYLFARRVLP